MLKTFSITLVSLVATLAYASTSVAETVMDKVAKTGVLTVGVRTDVVPYSYVNDKQELTGYSVELVELIRQQLETDLGRKVEINYITSENFSDRINKVINQEIDLVCDTTFTWERDKFVDFSLGYSVSGLKLLVKKGSSIKTLEDLKGKRIGFVGNTVQERSINVFAANVTPVPITNIEEGFKAVEEGKIDGFAFDALILEGIRQTVTNPDNFVVIPQESRYRHGIACMIPEGNSRFLDTVNYTIVKMMDGYLAGDPRYTEIVNRYFGKEGIVTINPESIRNFFEMIILTREQVPPSKP